MSKSVSLLLSAALTLGSVFTLPAAPLAKKAGATTPQQSRVASKAAAYDARMPQIAKAKDWSAKSSVNGLHKVQSEIKMQNRKALKSATSASHASAANINLVGSVIYSDSWTSAGYGMYTIPTVTGGTFELLCSSSFPISSGAATGTDAFYGTYLYDLYGLVQIPYLMSFSTNPWEELGEAEELNGFGLLALASAVDPTTDEVYACAYKNDGSGIAWSKLDYEAKTATEIADLQLQLMAVACDQSGQFFAIGKDQVLYKVDKASGVLTKVADTEAKTQYLVDGCINDQNGTMLMTYCYDLSEEESVGGLYEIDLATGATTVLAEFDNADEVTALYIAKPVAADKAPAAPGLSVSCDNGAMDVNVTITMPTTLFDGTPATGQVFTYTLEANGQQVLTGEANAGEVVNKTVSLTETGETKFVASVSNATGTSPKVKASCFVGKGAPAAPKDVVLVWADGTATLTWSAVTSSSDGGYLDPAGVTYTILDEDGVELATQASTTFTASVPATATYTMLGYSVKANYEGKSSEAVASNKVALGELAAPLSMDMTDADNFASHIVLDANGDGKTWNYGSGKTRYTYHSDNDADDWLFSPAIKLEAGKTYLFTALASANGTTFPERIEIYYGQSATAAGMTKQLVAPTVLSSAQDVELKGSITVETTGTYHIGFHAISDADNFYLNLTSYEISAPISGAAPAAPENLTVTPDADGDLKASISFKAPSKTVDGSTITGNVKVKVLRGDALVKEVSVAAGGSASVEDADVPEAGTYKYTVIAANAAGEEGLPASVSAYVGPTTPSDIDTSSVSLVETAPGKFHLAWDAVTTDVYGNTLKASNVSYKVYEIGVDPTSGGLAIGNLVATVTDCSYDYETEPIVEQGYFRLGVQVFNRNEGSEYIALGTTLTGTPYEMPVVYTNEESLQDFFLGIGGDGKVGLYSYETLEMNAQDGDDTFFGIQHQYLEQSSYLLTGKINISGSNPVFSFYVYSLTGVGEGVDENTNIVSAVVDGVDTELATISNSELDGDSWNRVVVPLSQFSGKTIQIRLTGVCNGYAFNLYDNLRISNLVDYDLSAHISAPEKVETGKEFNVTVKVDNEGAEDSDVYTVNLYRNGELVASDNNVYGVAQGESEVHTFKQTLGLHDGESAEFKAVVVYEADEDPDNNTTEAVTVARIVSLLPGVTGLAGVKTDAGHSLTWDAVVIGEPAPTEVTETFDEATSWAQEFEGWTFVDVDQSAIGGFQGMELPGMTAGQSLASFFVFDASGEEFNQTFAAHSGDKYLAALFRMDDGTTDDWAISPMLTGDAQTISFFAKSYSSQYPEKIEVWYSTTGTDVESFVKIEAFGTKTVSGEWTEYTANLPAGAKHFAIRSCATGSFMLMLDDVTFTRLDAFDGELKGYNVYCDGVKVNDAPVTEAAYTHVPADDAAHTYHVTALYDKGESELSEPVTIDQSGLDSILAAGLKVAVEGRDIVVTGAAGKLVTVNAIDGKTLHSATGDARVAVAPAVYLVTADGKTVKVLVR